MTYALDTNTISYYLQSNSQIKAKLDEAATKGQDIVIPPVSYYEIRRGFKHMPAPGKERAFIGLCRIYPIGEINLAVWEMAADIYAKGRKKGKIMHDADILIAAFCTVNGHTLVTNNTKDFENIDGLALVDWTK